MNLSPIAQDRRIDRLFAAGIAANLVVVTGMVAWSGKSPIALLVSGGALMGLVVVLLRRHGGSSVCAAGLTLAWAAVAIATVTAMPERLATLLNMVLVMSLLPWYRRRHLVLPIGLLFAITPWAVGVELKPGGWWFFAAFMLVQTGFMAMMAHRNDQLSRQVFDIEFLVRAMGKDGPVRLDLSVLRAETTLGERLKNVQERVAATLAQVQASAHAARRAASQLQSNGKELTARTQQTSGELDGAAMTLSQIAVIVKTSAEAAMAARQTAQAATVLAVDGGQIVGHMVEQMKTIEVASRRIADIIGVIEGIAFQTNMLALNAAVEAARAGEQGRGFAVVAAEVRMLAQSASTSAREIKTVVENSVQAISRGNELATEAEQTMHNLTAAVARVDETFHTLSADTNEHATGIEAIRDSMNELNASTQQNLRVAEHTQVISDELASRAAGLSAAMSGFRLAQTVEAPEDEGPSEDFGSADSNAAPPKADAGAPRTVAPAAVAAQRAVTQARTAAAASPSPRPAQPVEANNVEFF